MSKHPAMTLVFVFMTLVAIQPSSSQAQPQDAHQGEGTLPKEEPALQQDMDGQLEEKEYRCVSSNCSVTRAVCPHTCEDRGLAPENCQTWKSKSNEQECYVKDSRYDTDVMPDSPL